MTKRLEELFNLPTDTVEDEPETEPVEESRSTELVTTEALGNLEKIDQALPAIRGLESSDAEMDDIAEMAINSYKDLIDLGMNVEARVASDILSSASQFLGHAITARNAKINKKLKMIELQLRKAKLDQDAGEGPETGQGQKLDRNELLAEVLRAAKEDGKSE